MNVDHRGKERVRIVTTKENYKEVNQYKPVNSRILTVSLQMKEITLIQICTPVEGTTDEETLEFYGSLQIILDNER